MIKQYLEVIKPGIIFGNIISVIGGFLLATRAEYDYKLLFFTITGTSLVIASSCIANNYIDRNIDQKMERTKNRTLARKLISEKKILWYSAILGCIGCSILYFKVNQLVMWLSLIGFIIYVFVYSLYMKRKSMYSTIIGSISGSIPPIIGYCSINNQLNYMIVILFLVFSLWQMPHFYAITILHLKDYQSASIPVLPVIQGILITKHHIVIYIICFIIASLLLMISDNINYKYIVIMLILEIWWLYMAFTGYQLTINNSQIWAKKMFFLSIIIIISLNVILSINFILSHISIYNLNN